MHGLSHPSDISTPRREAASAFDILTGEALDRIDRSTALAIFAPTNAPPTQFVEGPRYVGLGLSTPADADPDFEVWGTVGATEAGTIGRLRFVRSELELFVHLLIDDGDDLAERIEAGYASLTEFVVANGCPNLARTWNFVPRINDGLGDQQRYKQFCVGRARALLQPAGVNSAPPAASCVGRAAPGILLAALASTTPVSHCENPRQLSAYAYPRRYGPVAPTFSRASILHRPTGDVLLIAGTASIVGHETCHLDDPVAQARESLTNLHSVVAAANANPKRSVLFAPYAPSYLRVYVRHATQVAEIRSVIENYFGPMLRPIYLVADICRSDLLVEIEGAWVAHADRTL